MAAEFELNLFIDKFKKLWKSGFTTHLDLDASNGKAWVGLPFHLGDAPGPAHHQDPLIQKSQNSPAKERRCERRGTLIENKKNEKQESELRGEAVEETNVGNDGQETAEKEDSNFEINEQETSVKEYAADMDFQEESGKRTPFKWMILKLMLK